MEEMLNIVDKEGQVITFCNGRITLTQIVIFIILGVSALLVIKFLAKTARTVALLVLVFLLSVNIGLLSPRQIRDAADTVRNRAMIYKYDSMSNDIRIKDSKAEIRINKNWIDVSKITAISKGKGKSLTISVGRKKYVTKNKIIIEFLKQF